MTYPIYEIPDKPFRSSYKKRQPYNNDPLPVPLSDPRFPGLRFEPARPGAKKKDPDYRDRIVADDTKFNIFDVPDLSFLKEAKLSLNEVQPFGEYTKGVVMIDCEWIGPDGGQATGTVEDVLVAIGIRNRGKSRLGCNQDKTEKQLLEWFFDTLAKLPDIHTITGYAIYGFFRGTEEVMVDLAMIYHRATHHGIGQLCPWKPTESKYKTYRWGNAVVFGKSLEVPAWDCDKYELIDIYPQIVLYDSLVRKLDNYKLKDSVIGFGLRQDRRIEIGDQIYDFWKRGEIDTIKEYLDYDLQDTELLWNFLIPQKYFMKSYMEWPLQRITTTGSGSWWNQYLIKITGQRPQKTQTCGYKGALTYYHAGCFTNLAKMDFGSLYPTIKETWKISSIKDTDLEMIKAEHFMGVYRSQIKDSEAFKSGDPDADGRQHTAKILRNAGYGLYNTTGLNFNDPYAGAAVTAYGRNLARYMITWFSDRGVKTVALDTDGCLVHFENDNFTNEERHKEFSKLCDELNKTLPGTTKVDYESQIPFLYVPPNLKTKKKAAETLADKLNSMDCYEDVQPDDVNPGLSKNYLYFDRQRDGSYKLSKKGKFKKRDKNYIQQGFVIDCITKLFYEGEDAVIKFAIETRAAIASGNFPLEKLQKTVLVAANWKAFPEWGFPIGSKPTIHYVWRGEVTGKRVIKKVFVPTADINELYAPEYYLAQFDEVMKELPISLPKEQLELVVD
jgi:DNA polymerase, archaea type